MPSPKGALRLSRLLEAEMPAQRQRIVTLLRASQADDRERALVGSAADDPTNFASAVGTNTMVSMSPRDQARVARRLGRGEALVDYHSHPVVPVPEEGLYPTYGPAPSPADLAYWSLNYKDNSPRVHNFLVAQPPVRYDRDYMRHDPASFWWFATERPQLMDPARHDAARMELQHALSKGRMDSFERRVLSYEDMLDRGALAEEIEPLASALLARYDASRGRGRAATALWDRALGPGLTRQDLLDWATPDSFEVLSGKKFAGGGGVLRRVGPKWRRAPEGAPLTLSLEELRQLTHDERAPGDFGALDTWGRGNEDVIRRVFNNTQGLAGLNEGSFYQGWVPLERIPIARGAGIRNGRPLLNSLRAGYSWEELSQSGERNPPPPLTLLVERNGRVSLLDGNHRRAFWDEQGYSYAPAYVLDHRPVSWLGDEGYAGGGSVIANLRARLRAVQDKLASPAERALAERVADKAPASYAAYHPDPLADAIGASLRGGDRLAVGDPATFQRLAFPVDWRNANDIARRDHLARMLRSGRAEPAPGYTATNDYYLNRYGADFRGFGDVPFLLVGDAAPQAYPGRKGALPLRVYGHEGRHRMGALTDVFGASEPVAVRVGGPGPARSSTRVFSEDWASQWSPSWFEKAFEPLRRGGRVR